MTDLIDTVAELTHLRDKNDLALSFAKAVFHLAEASSLIVWRLRGSGAEPMLVRRVALPAGCGAPAEQALNAVLEHTACVQTRRYVSGRGSDGTRHVFPICTELREVTGLVEVVRPQRLEPVLEHAIDGLMRVYGNYLGLLDYGARDELTGLLNRRTFNGFFKQVVAENPVRAVIAVADIDHFKRINDEFGHIYGDEVLILMARLLERCFGERDGLFRFGGEEFLIVLNGMTLDQAWEVVEAFRNAVQTEVFPQVGRVTISVGLAAVRPDDTGAGAFGRADEALYAAKERGRNQVQCHEWLVLEGALTETKKEGEVELF